MLLRAATALSLLLACALAQQCICDASSMLVQDAASATAADWDANFLPEFATGPPESTGTECTLPSGNVSWVSTGNSSQLVLGYATAVYASSVEIFETLAGGFSSALFQTLDISGNDFVLGRSQNATCECAHANPGACGNCTATTPELVEFAAVRLPLQSELTVDFWFPCGPIAIDAVVLHGYTNCSCCGNGRVEFAETCDDGESASADGCDSDCQTEAGWTCSGEPSVCTQTTTTTTTTAAAAAAATTPPPTPAAAAAATTTTAATTTATTSTTGGLPSPSIVYLTFVFNYPLTNFPNYPTQEQVLAALSELTPPSSGLNPAAIGFYSIFPTLPPGALLITLTLNATDIPPATAQENADALAEILSDEANQRALGQICTPRPCTVNNVGVCASDPPCASAINGGAALVSAVALVAAMIALVL